MGIELIESSLAPKHTMQAKASTLPTYEDGPGPQPITPLHPSYRLHDLEGASIRVCVEMLGS